MTINRVKIYLISTCVGIVSLCCQTVSGDLITPTSVTLSGTVTGYGAVSNLRDNSGLTGATNSASATHVGATEDNSWATIQPGGTNTSDYFDPIYGAKAPVLTFEFDRQYDVHQMVLWNYASSDPNTRENGAKLVSLEFSANGIDGWSSNGLAPIKVDKLGSGKWPNAQIFGFESTYLAKAVRLTITDNYYDGSGTGGDRVGLSEVKFGAPEPSSLLLAATGLFGLLCFAFLRQR